jgi:DNA mismatch repair protein MutS2
MSACLELAAVGTLVLVDELTSGTDPEEGAALACAIVEALVERGAALCVTTHYERLKALAASHPRLVNAAVGFDRGRLLPTFAIEHGIPGASSALLVARRYGIEPEIITRAEALLPHGLIDQRALERELDEQRARWQAAADEAEAERRTAADLRRQLDQERRRALTEERGVLTRETQAVLDEVRQARARLRQAEAKVKNLELGASSVSETRRAVNEAAQFVAIGGKLRKAAAALDPAPAPRLERLTWDDLAPGARVTLNSLGASGHVVAKPRRDQVTVAVGSMKTTVSIDALSLLPGHAAAPSPPSPSGKSQGKKARERGAGFAPESAASRPEGGTPQRTSANTISLIGQRVDAALEQLDVAIDKLVRGNEHVAFVLHGHGTGALRNAVREHVRRHPNVIRAEPAERDDGGDALTLLWLG